MSATEPIDLDFHCKFCGAPVDGQHTDYDQINLGGRIVFTCRTQLQEGCWDQSSWCEDLIVVKAIEQIQAGEAVE